jgi:hypothetical protein
MNVNEPPKDHIDEETAPHRSSFEEHIRSKATWQRLLFMLILGLLFSVGVTVGCILVILQFFWVLFTGETKRELSAVGRQLAEYGRQVALYMTFNTEDRPFPFDLDWPSA